MVAFFSLSLPFFGACCLISKGFKGEGTKVAILDNQNGANIVLDNMLKSQNKPMLSALDW